MKPASPRNRPPKAVKEWRILDPACGSGHFLVVAFDLLRQLYAEERRLAEEGKVPADWIVPEEDVAETILRENLHGIDIDPRSVQISALALWLKARATGLAHPPVLNLVVADCVLGKGEAYETLLARYRDAPEIQKAIEAIWDALQQMRELGSLIRVEEELEAAVRKVRRDRPIFHQNTDWEQFRSTLISGLRQAFEAEARMEDLGHRLFGIEGRKGLDFVELVSRRYDVVCTNPPYMGSKNMGKVLKDFVRACYGSGSSDLFSSFILRCGELATDRGFIAMVTQEAWLFNTTFDRLRIGRTDDARGLLNTLRFHGVVQLSRGAFGEISGAVVSPVIFTAEKDAIDSDWVFCGIRATTGSSPQEKDVILREAVKNPSSPVRFERRQQDFLRMPGGSMAFWLSQPFVRLFAECSHVGDRADVKQGSSLRMDEFLRFHWEVPPDGKRWRLMAKGGGYSRWSGFLWYTAHWGNDGTEAKAAGCTLRNVSFVNRDGLTYTDAADRSMSVRDLPRHVLFSDKGPGIFPRSKDPLERYGLAAVLNSRLATFLLRALTPGIDFSEGYVSGLPLPVERLSQLGKLAEIATQLKRALRSSLPVEATFARTSFERATKHDSLEQLHRDAMSVRGAVEACQHSLEAGAEKLLVSGYGLKDETYQEVTAEAGLPSGWHPILFGYDSLPVPPLEPVLAGDASKAVKEVLGRSASTKWDNAQMPRLKTRIRESYEAGARGTVDEEAEESEPETDPTEESETSDRFSLPLPAETLTEDLSQRLQIHPVSVYWLLEELRREEGVVCQPELKRHVEDFVSVTILRMLGHRWPEQDRHEEDQGHPMMDPKWVDEDGIIPLAPCAGERSLIERLRAFLDERFGPDKGPNVEAEAGRILGKSLDKWVEREFFKRHVKQFKKRPIAWHLRSERGMFQSLVSYHKFDHDRLHALRARYVKDTLDGLRRVLAEERQKGEGSRAAVKLEEQIAEVQAFDEKLRRLLEGSDRDYRIWVPWKEAERQPRGWRPDVNDGVRVNIAPVQRADLLATAVLAAKDLKSLLAPEGS